MNTRTALTLLTVILSGASGCQMHPEAGATPGRNVLQSRQADPAGQRPAIVRKQEFAETDREVLASAEIQPRRQQSLQVRADAFEHEGEIPELFSDYGEGISPAIRWQGAPEGTRSFVILMEDPNAPQPRPFVHWVLYNLPGHHDHVPMGLNQMLRLEHLDGALQGRNSRNTIGYFGPRPPEGNPAHQYHFQVFALDRELDLPIGASRQQVIDAMATHVLAMGEVAGRFQKE
jgi:Raf kinase inhibitor-like YbhB/YbcL family protein